MKKLIFLLLLVLLIAAGLIYYKKWRSDFLHKKVPELVFLESDSLYRITYDAVDIDEVDGEIMIKESATHSRFHLQKTNRQYFAAYTDARSGSRSLYNRGTN